VLDTEGFEPAQGSISIVSVVPGDGLVEVFRSLGTNAVVHGGQTMNPSTQELLKAVDSLPGNEVVILPNNKNIIMVANQVKNLSKKHVVVVPSATLPQGITALSRFNFEEPLESNAANMTSSLKDVQTGEVTRAVRTATINGIPVETGQWIGLLNDELSVSAPSKEEVIWQLLEQMGAANSELLTFYYGKDVTEVEAETLLAQVKARYTSQEVQSVPGGQPHYHYIISAE
jgi:dihydroxyacetone kinase-like predicted kinase